MHVVVLLLLLEEARSSWLTGHACIPHRHHPKGDKKGKEDDDDARKGEQAEDKDAT